MKLVAKQRDEALRATYAAEMSVYDPGLFVFLDEIMKLAVTEGMH